VDNRCPLCGRDLGRRKLAHSVIARMDVDCPHCAGRLSLNVHRAERAIVLLGTAAVLALAVLSYAEQRQALLLAALAAGAAAGTAMFVVERFWLRAWPRYAARPPRPGME
jgi:hypothetical protein